MTQEALKLALEVNESMKDVLKQVNELIAENKSLKEALAVDKESLTTEAQPPQRTWVGLTDEEREDIALEVPIDAVSITEAKLKERNT